MSYLIVSHIVKGWLCVGVMSACCQSASLTASVSGSNTDAVKCSSKNSKNSRTTAAASFPSREDRKAFSFVLEFDLRPFMRKQTNQE